MTDRLRLALAAVCSLVCSSAAPADSQGAFHVLSYEIHLQPDFATKTISGTEIIRFKNLADDLAAISFSANSLDVTASIGDEIVVGEISGDRRVFHLPTPMMRAGQVALLTLSFKGSAPKGLVFGTDTVYANYFTCDALICDQDRPGDKAPVDFELTVPQGMEVLAPGSVMNHARSGDTEIWGWRENRPTSPYLIGFAAGRFQRVTLPGTSPTLTVLTSNEPADRVQTMFAGTRRMLKFFEEKSGVRFDEAAYTQVLVDGDEAQEAARHSIIGKEEIQPILTDPHEDWVIAHELAHQWWGNSLTCADWSELWLNEGMTVFMVAAYKEQRWGRAAYDHELELANKRWAAAKAQGFDVPLSWKGEYPSLKLKRAMAYAKAVVFLDTLRRELGEKTFWRAIKSYTRAHKDSVATAIDLQHAFEKTSSRDLSPIFAEWVFGKS